MKNEYQLWKVQNACNQIQQDSLRGLGIETLPTNKSTKTVNTTRLSKRHNSQSDTTLKATRLSTQLSKATRLSKATLKASLTLVPDSAMKDESTKNGKKMQ